MTDISELTTPETIKAIYADYETKQEKPRPHLGASQIGHPCERALWYGFHWVTYPKFKGRVLRLFERGQNEEAVFIKNLRDVGVTVWDVDPDTNKQIRFETYGGHFGGSCDGIAKGILEAPAALHVLEFKTSSDKLFKQLQRDGVEKAKPMHYAQMQVYMKAFDIERAYYMAVNKDNDELHAERIKYSPVVSRQLFEKAERIITAALPPGRLSDDPAYFECKWCDHWEVCHNNKLPEVNCRTCAHSTPELTGGWSCAENNNMIEGCKNHVYQPVFFVGRTVEKYENGTLTLDDGTKNGPNGMLSVNLKETWGTELTTDIKLIELQDKFGATVKKAWAK